MLKEKTRILLHQAEDFATVTPDFHPRSPKLSEHGAASAPGSEPCGAVRIKQPPPPGSICPWMLHSCRLFLQLLLKITEARGRSGTGAAGSGCSPGQRVGPARHRLLQGSSAPLGLGGSSSYRRAKLPGFSRNVRPCSSPGAIEAGGHTDGAFLRLNREDFPLKFIIPEGAKT